MTIEVPLATTDASHEIEPLRDVHTFVVLDLDRTLLRSDRLNEWLCEHIDRSHDIQPDDGDPYEFIQGQTGASLSVLAYLSGRYGQAAEYSARQQLLAQAEMTEELLYPGARELIEGLERQTVPYGILTYGDTDNQQFKLDLLHKLVGKHTGEINTLVTNEQRKAQWIESHWRAADGTERFTIHPDLSPTQTIHAQNILIVDDKPENTEADDGHIVEFVIDNSLSPSEKGQPIAKLYELVAAGQLHAWVDEMVQQNLS